MPKPTTTPPPIRRIIQQKCADDCGWAAVATVAAAYGVDRRLWLKLRDEMPWDDNFPAGSRPDEIEEALTSMDFRVRYIGASTLVGIRATDADDYEARIVTAATKQIVVALTLLDWQDLVPTCYHWLVLGPHKKGFQVYDVNDCSRVSYEVDEEREDYPFYCAYVIKSGP